MNDLDEIHEDVLSAVRDSFRALPVRMCPRPDTIIAAVRARSRRRRVSVAAAGLTTAALIAVVASGLNASDTRGRTAPTAGAPTARFAAFDLVSNGDGTSTYTLSPDLLSDTPAALTATLAQHGIPAIVRQGSFCSSDPAPGGIAQILVPAASTSQGQPGDDKAVAIDPSAIPTGTELSIGLFTTEGSTAVRLALVSMNDYSCVDMPPGTETHPMDQPANKASNGAGSNNTVRNPAVSEKP
jgi:hypothetical protein